MTAHGKPTSARPLEIARNIVAALDGDRQIAPFTSGDAAFDLAAAYRIAATVRRLREDRGERVVGHKIGFTNVDVDCPVPFEMLKKVTSAEHPADILEIVRAYRMALRVRLALFC